jgi:peroxiredoxin
MTSARFARIAAGVVIVVVVASAAVTAAPPSSVSPAGVAFRGVDGRSLELSALLEQGPVLLDFWATWCRPCERSLPATQALHERFGPRGLTVIGVSVDGPRNWARVRPFARRLGLTFPIAVDEDGSLAQRFRAVGVPTTVLIAGDGRIVRTRTGWIPGEDDSLAAAVVALLPETGAPPTP